MRIAECGFGRLNLGLPGLIGIKADFWSENESQKFQNSSKNQGLGEHF
jgi:hypothetical protein